MINYKPNSYEGFALNSERSSGDVKITSDGTAVKNVYYNRNTYKIHFYVPKSWNWWGRPQKWEEDESLLITARYGEDVSVSGMMQITASICGQQNQGQIHTIL